MTSFTVPQLVSATALTCVVTFAGGGCGSSHTSGPVFPPKATDDSATATPALPGPAGGWVSERGRGHPLVGKVWDVEHHAFVAPAHVFAGLEHEAPQARLLLGEKHDNADHHRLQAEILRALTRGDRPVAVAFEMFDVSQQPDLDRYLASSGASADGLGPALGWERSGWPSWSIYAPIARVALEHKSAIVPANLPPATVRAVAHQGLGALARSVVAELRLDRPFPSELEAPLMAELQAAHCEELPASVLPAMAAAQHARDAHMAAVLARSDRPAVLIAGAGHARKDHGVPYFLRQRNPTLLVQSIAFLEVEDELTSPERYAARYSSDTLPFDLVWFTPRATDDDPCAAFHR